MLKETRRAERYDLSFAHGGLVHDVSCVRERWSGELPFEVQWMRNRQNGRLSNVGLCDRRGEKAVPFLARQDPIVCETVHRGHNI